LERNLLDYFDSCQVKVDILINPEDWKPSKITASEASLAAGFLCSLAAWNEEEFFSRLELGVEPQHLMGWIEF
jgi:hypothetical protein